MKRFKITAWDTEFRGFIVLGYDGYLVEFVNNTDMSNGWRKRFFDILQIHQSHFKGFKKRLEESGSFRVEEFKESIEFASFWKKYDVKDGSKKRAETLWKKLSTTQKYKALFFIDRYNEQIKKSGVGKMYADTYLRREIWNND